MHALIRLYLLPVCPLVLDHTSLMPASFKTFWHSFSTQRPVPLGAGISLITAEPHFPSTENGIECGLLQPHCQLPHPRRILMTFSLEFLMAFSRAGTVSLDLP